MKNNIGSADRLIRLIIAAIVVTLYFTNVISGILGIALLVVAGILAITSMISTCPIYLAFGISTRKVKNILKK